MDDGHDLLLDGVGGDEGHDLLHDLLHDLAHDGVSGGEVLLL